MVQQWVFYEGSRFNYFSLNRTYSPLLEFHIIYLLRGTAVNENQKETINQAFNGFFSKLLR